MNSESNTRTLSEVEPVTAFGRASPVFAGSLAFEDVGFDIRGKTIIDGVSFRLAPGKTYCLLGSSGSGKTTLLRLAAGIETPSRGRILLDGLEIAGPSQVLPPEKRNIGLMFQDFALFPHLTVLQNVAFGLTALDRTEARKVARLALARVGLSTFEARYPVSLSGGEQQRVALARTIVPRPQIILMDEPFSSLDQQLKERVRADTLAILKETRATSMLVTHDPQEALAFADELLVMKAGKIIQQGKPEDFLSQPRDAEVAQLFRFYNVFDATVSQGSVQLPMAKLDASRYDEGQAVHVLVPPHDLHLKPNDKNPIVVVTDQRLLGQHLQVVATVLSSGLRIILHMKSREAVPPGTLCGLVLTPENTHVFAR